MSIVDEDYRVRYRGKGDWFKQLVDETCYETKTIEVEHVETDGTITREQVESKRKTFSVDRMFTVALENGVPEERLEKFRAIVGQRASEGRIRMSVGNMLRTVARKNGSLTVDGVVHNAPEEFVNKPVRELKKAA